MGALSWLFGGNDRELGATQYSHQVSASTAKVRKEQARADKASRKNRASYRNGGAQRAADQGQAWDAKQRRQQGGY
jgi:hypothetical protein